MATPQQPNQRKELLATLLQPSTTRTDAPAERKDQLSAVIMILAFDDEALELVFDKVTGFNPQALLDRYPNLNDKIVTLDRLRTLAESRILFANVQLAWRDLLNFYEPGPCPSKKKMDALVDLAKTFDQPV